MRHVITAASITACLGLFFCGCASSGKETAAKPDTGRPPIQGVAEFPAVTLTATPQSMGEAVRAIGEQAGGGLVLMKGLEQQPLQGIQFQSLPYQQAVQGLAAANQYQVQQAANYYFVFPAGYEALQELALEQQVAAHYPDATIAAAFGAGTRLYDVFAILGKALDITIVGDNNVADSQCGEFTFQDAPLGAVLEAALKSARVLGASLTVDVNPEYIYLGSAENRSAASALLNGGDLTEDQQKLLATRVNLQLPEPSDNPVFHRGAVPLSVAIPSFTRQTGVRLLAVDTLLVLPVNPVAMNDIPLGTAMDLLVRQWLVPKFGYEIRGNEVVLVER